MLLRVPDFYEKFVCIADRCTDTCCVGWEIDVDERSLARYNKMAKFCREQGCADQQRAEFIQKLLANIEDGHFKLLPGDRCPFLKADGLCEMICHLGCNGTDKDENGENVLCDICREHPRFVEVYGDVMEKGLGLCCEEAARLLLTSGCHCEERSDEAIEAHVLPLHFVESEIDDEPDEMPEGAEEARDAIFAERDRIFELLADSSKPLNQRLIDVLDFAESVNIFEDEDGVEDEDRAENAEECHCEQSDAIEAGSKLSSKNENLSDTDIKQTWIEILGEGESYGPAWDRAFERMVRTGRDSKCHCERSEAIGAFHSLFTDEDGARIVAYLIFRYYAKSLFDGDSLTKVQFAIFFWIMLKHFGEELSADSPAGANALTRKINAVKLLSKQTEYSEEIMEILADNFYQNEAFSLEQFRMILST
ncbi:MAG: flagellin lysine-N-methylase [Fibrobacter sp.]|nr:flagellin lysine-N-methylase [Fibrobacter sp.]